MHQAVVSSSFHICCICIRWSNRCLLHMHEGSQSYLGPISAEDRTIDYVFGLLDIPWWYYAIAAVIGLAVWKCWRWEGGLLAGYAFLVLAETVFIRKAFAGEHLRLELFWSWRQWSVQRNQVLTNVVMFIPVGVMTGWLWKWRGLWIAAGLSLLIEVLQLITARGLMEFDDVIHNCIGAAIGIMLLMMMKKLMCTREGDTV